MEDRRIKLVEALERFRSDLVRARANVWPHRHVPEMFEIDALLSVADSAAMKLQQMTLSRESSRLKEAGVKGSG